ncbi:MAG TPA: MFS transporter [Mycobacteriales bacterium]|nr:MFS transporter [Mycobacteriales bacterium]
MSQASTQSPAPASGAAPHEGHDNKWWTLVAVSLGTFMLLLDITIVNVALPNIQDELHSSFSDLQWVVDAYALTLAALLLTTGALADMYGRKRLYVLGLGLFTIASVLCGVAQGSLMLEISRALQGVGGATMFSVSLALLAHAFRGKDRGVAFGVWGATTGFAVAVGPVLGGALVSGLSWRYIFFVNLPIGIGALALTFFRVEESRDPEPRRPDWWGFILFTAGLASVIYALIEAGLTSFGTTRVVTCFVVGGALIIAFLVAEALVSNPMFELSLFRLPTFSGGAIAAFGISASIFSMLLYLTLYLQDLLRYSALQTGVRLVILSGCILVIATVAGRVSSHVPVRMLIGPGLILVGVSMLLMRGLTASSSWTHLIPGMIVGGVGVGMINPPLASTAVGVVQPQRAGMASGINSTFRQVGIATGIALLGTLFSHKVSSQVSSGLAHTSLASKSGALGGALQNGEATAYLKHLPPQQAQLASHVARASFTAGLNEILLVSAVIAFVSGALAFVLIRGKDFVQHQPAAAGG